LEAQTVYTSIEQSVLIPFTHFGPSGDLLVTLAKALVLTLIFGIVTGFVQGLVQLKKGGPTRIWYVMLLIGIVGVTTIVVFA
ncbi:glycosyltransferase, partial [Streptococcus thermophilus]|nr:glycosyltransferase [Streptococcus thermophilus]